jgi:serine/threonine protein kinase
MKHFPDGFRPELVLKIFRPDVRALQLLHSNKFVHSDLKPQSIGLTSDGVPKVCKSGILQRFVPISRSFPHHHGTVLYLSPEFFHDKHVKTSIDVWGLGCLLYELLFGKVLLNEDLIKRLNCNTLLPILDISPNVLDSVPMPEVNDDFVISADLLTLTQTIKTKDGRPFFSTMLDELEDATQQQFLIEAEKLFLSDNRPQDLPTAFQLYKSAAGQNNHFTYSIVGYLCSMGIGTPE